MSDSRLSYNVYVTARERDFNLGRVYYERINNSWSKESKLSTSISTLKEINEEFDDLKKKYSEAYVLFCEEESTIPDVVRTFIEECVNEDEIEVLNEYLEGSSKVSKDTIGQEAYKRLDELNDQLWDLVKLYFMISYSKFLKRKISELNSELDSFDD